MTVREVIPTALVRMPPLPGPPEEMDDRDWVAMPTLERITALADENLALARRGRALQKRARILEARAIICAVASAIALAVNALLLVARFA